MKGGRIGIRGPPPQTARGYRKLVVDACMPRETPLPAPSRVVVENVQPEIDAGRFPAKRTVGEPVDVTADIYADGHDVLAAVLRHRPARAADWTETRMAPVGNDRWTAAFTVTSLEIHRFTVEAWVDAFATWRRGFQKKVDAGLVEAVDLLVGAEIVAAAAGRAAGEDARALRRHADGLRDAAANVEDRTARALDPALAVLMDRHPDRTQSGHAPREIAVVVERARARFGAWYEMFPRSCAQQPGRHGTFADCEERLAYVAAMGFDVLYLPPIHPIGRTHRKGPNNAPAAGPGDVGSPWAIGGAEGGHKAVHPDLGTLADFRSLLRAAEAKGIEIAMDVAFQCSPDHPYVRDHPEWFRHRPDGSVQYAENPPKKYEDIYPIEFDTPARAALWDELKSVVLFWIEQGVRIFRVDNPHTKAFPFWEWLIAEVRRDHPDAIFLAEAFTRPKVMYQLAKLGFSQSYTYFTWRNTKEELTDYLLELTTTRVREFFRPNLWPNTPDILPEPLQVGGRAMFQARLLLAATLGASYGIYGPAFELLESQPRAPGSEEYLDSEKYQIRHWDLDRPDSLKDLVARLNRIRRENPALQDNLGLRFHEIDNPHLIAYSKATRDLADVVLVVVNLDPHHVHSGWLLLPLEDLGLKGGGAYQVHDLVSGARFFWTGPRNYVQIDPAALPGHIFRIRRRVRTERDFDYFL
jgi:starch synthase (maltosyl-transferring)